MDLRSGLRWYSLGIVVEDKPRDTNVIVVSPIEHLSMVEDGPIADSKQVHGNKLPDQDGVSTHTETASVNYVTASWRGFGSNRASSPDVVKNESVMLMQYKDDPAYYWIDLGFEPGLRRTEDVLYTFGNIPGGFEVFDKATSYWFQVSTKDKHVTFRTNMNDGEFTGYTLHVNTKKGLAVLEDDLGTGVTIESRIGKLGLNAKHIDLNASETLTLNGKTLNIGNILAAALSGQRDVPEPASALMQLEDIEPLDGARGSGSYRNGDNTWNRTTQFINIASAAIVTRQTPSVVKQSDSDSTSADNLTVVSNNTTQTVQSLTVNAENTTNNSSTYTLNSPSTNVMLK